MTLKSLATQIAKLGIKKKLINYSCAGLSLYELNEKKVDDYPVLFVIPNGDHQITENLVTYRLTFYYLDRLEKDRNNDFEILSYSIENLKNLINSIRDIRGVIDVDDEYSITNFTETQKLNDAVAGAYAQINITVINDGKCDLD